MLILTIITLCLQKLPSNSSKEQPWGRHFHLPLLIYTCRYYYRNSYSQHQKDLSYHSHREVVLNLKTALSTKVYKWCPTMWHCECYKYEHIRECTIVLIEVHCHCTCPVSTLSTAWPYSCTACTPNVYLSKYQLN